MSRRVMCAAGVLSASAVILANCADLNVQKVTHKDQSALQPLRGTFTYFLPRTAINITVSATVMQCGALVADPSALKEAKQDGTDFSPNTPDTKKLVFKISGSTASVLEPDPNFQYRLDYDAARTWLKQINFTINTASNKIFQSYNGQIIDQAGPIAVATLTTAVQIAGAAIIPPVPKVGAQFEETNGKLVPKPDCSSKVVAGLKTIVGYQKALTTLKKRIDKYRSNLATTVPGKNDPVTIWSAAVAALQAQISAETTKSLTQTRIYKYYPSQNDLTLVHGLYVAKVSEPVSGPVRALLSDTGQAWFDDKTNNSATYSGFAMWYAAHRPYMIVVAVDPTTYFDEQAYKTNLKSGETNPLDAASPGGLLIRDPAVGFAQRCTLAPNITPAIAEDPADATVWSFVDQSGFDACVAKLSLMTTDQTADSDDSTRAAMELPQLGRVLVFDEHSALFENATLAVTLNTDGSIQSVSTQDLSTAASGLSGLGAAATAASSAESARNTAVSSVNTEVTTQAQFSDTVNKALADCLAQAKTIAAAGITPLPCR